MAAGAGLSRFLPPARRVIQACLIAQVGLGWLVVHEDALDFVRRLGGEEIRPVPYEPVRPGDQRREFDPRSVPERRQRDGAPPPPFDLPGELSGRLSFTMERSDDYGRVLLVSGRIDGAAGARFLGHLESLSEPPDIVALHSPGGAVREALKIGRHIRERGLATLISPDAACMSACPYILAGGTERIVSLSGWVGVHQHYHGEDTGLPAFLAVEEIQHGQGRTLAYIDEMDVDPALMVHALETPPDDIYILVEAELERYRLATRIVP